MVEQQAGIQSLAQRINLSLELESNRDMYSVSHTVCDVPIRNL